MHSSVKRSQHLVRYSSNRSSSDGVVMPSVPPPPSTLARVETRLEDILTLQSPCGGEEDGLKQHIEGGVAVVSRMLPSSSSSSFGKRGGGGVGGGAEAVSAEQFARGVQDSWRIGKKGCDNGFLLVASREDRSFAISVVRS